MCILHTQKSEQSSRLELHNNIQLNGINAKLYYMPEIRCQPPKHSYLCAFYFGKGIQWHIQMGFSVQLKSLCSFIHSAKCNYLSPNSFSNLNLTL